MQGLIEIAPSDRAAYPLRPFPIRHGLSDHPLFALERLVELARTLPAGQIESNAGEAAVDQGQVALPLMDLAPGEIVRRIREVRAWMVLNHVETVPAYRALMEQVLAGAAADLGYADAAAAGFLDIQGFIYVSSAGATTPFHADPGDNFFVQISGDKFFHMIDNRDGAVMSEESAETVISAHGNVPYRPEFETRGDVFALTGGDGCFVPYLWPHWVRTGSGHSISMAITWKSPVVIRANRVRAMNAALRRIGFPQQPPGISPAWDGIKGGAYALARAALMPVRASRKLHDAARSLLFGRTFGAPLGAPRKA